MRIAFDIELMRPGYAIVQAALGADRGDVGYEQDDPDYVAQPKQVLRKVKERHGTTH
jgi:hypothetical protein